VYAHNHKIGKQNSCVIWERNGVRLLGSVVMRLGID